MIKHCNDDFATAKERMNYFKNKFDYSTTCSPSLKEYDEIIEISDKFRPGLSEFILNTKKLTIKVHLLYCFINEVTPHSNMKFFKFDENINRITENISLKEFAYRHRPRGHETNRFSLSKLYETNLDLKYPKLIKYSCTKINIILNRIMAKHTNCIICSNPFRVRHSGHKLCSNECFRKHRSIIQIGSNNTIHRQSEETRKRVALEQSKRMVQKIQSGEFTPHVTNSWANSKVNLKEFGIYFRSSWEAYFYVKTNKNNITLEYEKTRILYYDSELNKVRNYIVDFTDNKNKIIFEIKPNRCKQTQNVRDKEKAAVSWAVKNGYTFTFISDDWFFENYDSELLSEIDNHKITKGMKQFK